MGLIKKLMRKPDRKKAVALVEKGVGYAAASKPKAALKLYLQAQAADDSYPLAHINEGLARLDLFNLARESLDASERAQALEAIAAAFERGLERDPENLAALRGLGFTARRLGRFIDAEAAWEKLVEVAPAEHPYRKEASKELAELRPKAKKERTLRATVTAALDEAASADALEAALQEAAPDLDTDDVPPKLYWAAGVIHRRLGQDDDAIKRFGACVGLDPRHFDARRELATLCMRKGFHKRALEHSMIAYQEDPTNPALVCNVGVCHLALGHLDKAAEFIELASGLDPDDPIIQRAMQTLQEAQAAG